MCHWINILLKHLLQCFGPEWASELSGSFGEGQSWPTVWTSRAACLWPRPASWLCRLPTRQRWVSHKQLFIYLFVNFITETTLGLFHIFKCHAYVCDFQTGILYIYMVFLYCLYINKYYISNNITYSKLNLSIIIIIKHGQNPNEWKPLNPKTPSFFLLLCKSFSKLPVWHVVMI